VFEFLKTKLKSDIKARSFHLHSSSLYNGNVNVNGNGLREAPVIGRCATKREQSSLRNGASAYIDGFREKFSELGLEPFGSPTLSDQALMRFPSFKLGPGESSRSHSADEYICVSEIRKAIEIYLELLA
jgi:acetylornithine deacetylase